MNFGLERIHALLDALERPDERTKIIHVAGTNGKGSTCAYMASVLLTCGYTVGRFNSPHLLEPRDSINVNGEPISQAAYNEAMDRVAELNKTIGASSFECLVGAAFYAFDKAKVEFVVLEVGLGGLLDATNAIRSPVMTVITAIGMDHAAILGNTIEKIALAKAGIMKPGCPVVIAPQDTTTTNVSETLIQHAQETGAPYKQVQPATLSSSTGVCELDCEGTRYTYTIRLCGDYQRMNSATAVTALDWLKRLGTISMSEQQLAEGMKGTRWPGRLDWIEKEAYPLLAQYHLSKVLVDGAHNLPAAIALRNYVDTLKAERVIWIIGSTEGKDITDMLKTLIGEKDMLLSAPFSQPEGMPWIQCVSPQAIVEQQVTTTTTSDNKVACSGLKEALSIAGKRSEEKDVIVLCGSLYLVADLYRLLL